MRRENKMPYNESILKNISKIDAVFISNQYCEMLNEQSCDCNELIIKNGEMLTLLTLETIGDENCINFQEINEIDKDNYIYEVDFTDESFEYDKELLLENGQVEGIRFIFKDVHLFVFALENNLVLTKSKYDLFNEKDTEVWNEEYEAKLKIFKKK